MSMIAEPFCNLRNEKYDPIMVLEQVQDTCIARHTEDQAVYPIEAYDEKRVLKKYE
ncbi:MAG: hypothetical protein ACOX4J_07860 [Anaerovoracaceae bacterium]